MTPDSKRLSGWSLLSSTSVSTMAGIRPLGVLCHLVCLLCIPYLLYHFLNLTSCFRRLVCNPGNVQLAPDPSWVHDLNTAVRFLVLLRLLGARKDCRASAEQSAPSEQVSNMFNCLSARFCSKKETTLLFTVDTNHAFIFSDNSATALVFETSFTNSKLCFWFK